MTEDVINAYDNKFTSIVNKKPDDITDDDLEYIKTKSSTMYSVLLLSRFESMRYKRAVERVKIMTDRQILEELYLKGFVR